MTARIGPFWAAHHRFVIESGEQEVLVELEHRLGDLRHEPSPNPTGPPGALVVFRLERTGLGWMSHPWALWRDGEACETMLTRDEIVAAVVGEVTRLVRESATLPTVAIPASALVRHGHALALIGPSHSARSTLAGWLVRSGWDFLSDGISLLDVASGRPVVQPFWRPIRVRRSGPLAEFADDAGRPSDAIDAISAMDSPWEVMVPVSRLGRLAAPAPLVALVNPTHAAAGDVPLEPLSAAAALVAMAEYVPSLGDRSVAVFGELERVAATIPAFSATIGDLDACTARLEALVDDLASASAAVESGA